MSKNPRECAECGRERGSKRSKSDSVSPSAPESQGVSPVAPAAGLAPATAPVPDGAADPGAQPAATRNPFDRLPTDVLSRLTRDPGDLHHLSFTSRSNRSALRRPAGVIIQEAAHEHQVANLSMPEVASVEYVLGGAARTVPLEEFTQKLNQGIVSELSLAAELYVSSSSRVPRYVQVELRLRGPGPLLRTVLCARLSVPRGREISDEDVQTYIRHHSNRSVAYETLWWLRHDVRIHEAGGVDLTLYNCWDPAEEKKNIDDCLPVQGATRYVASVEPLHPALPKFQQHYRTRGPSLLSPPILAALRSQLESTLADGKDLNYSHELVTFKPRPEATAQRENAGTPWLRVHTHPAQQLLRVWLELRDHSHGSMQDDSGIVILSAERTLDLWETRDVLAYVLDHVTLFTGKTTLVWLQTIDTNLVWTEQLCTRLDPTQTTRDRDGGPRQFRASCPAMGSVQPLHPELLSNAEAASFFARATARTAADR
eukprot:g77642.t1